MATTTYTEQDVRDAILFRTFRVRDEQGAWEPDFPVLDDPDERAGALAAWVRGAAICAEARLVTTHRDRLMGGTAEHLARLLPPNPISPIVIHDAGHIAMHPTIRASALYQRGDSRAEGRE